VAGYVNETVYLPEGSHLEVAYRAMFDIMNEIYTNAGFVKTTLADRMF